MIQYYLQGEYLTIIYVYSRTTTIVAPYSLDNETITYTDYRRFKEYIILLIYAACVIALIGRLHFVSFHGQ